MKFVVASGLTRRLVSAKSARDARVKFLKQVPRGTILKVPHEAVQVWEATDANLAEFYKGKNARFDDQLALDLGENRQWFIEQSNR